MSIRQAHFLISGLAIVFAQQGPELEFQGAVDLALETLPSGCNLAHDREFPAGSTIRWTLCRPAANKVERNLV